MADARYVPFNIRRLRLSRGWSQARLARAADLCQQVISGTERGLYASPGRLVAIARALSVDAAALHRRPGTSEVMQTITLGRSFRDAREG